MIDKGAVVDFLVRTEALKFGEFLLKSGRKAPYFINTGCFDDGAKIAGLSRFYAEKIVSLDLPQVDVVFGPAYKGIPLCVSTSMTLARDFNRNIGFTFNRKEVKERGEGGQYVGTPLRAGMNVVIVEDVVTAGTTLHEVVPVLRDKLSISVASVVILVDRCERRDKSQGALSAVQEAEKELGITVHPILTIHDIVEHLSRPNGSGVVLDEELKARIGAYLAEYGVG